MMNTNSRFEKGGKGFYAVIALSVIALCAAVFGITGMTKKIRSAGEKTTQTTIDWDNHSAVVSETAANKHETGIKDERTTETQSETTEAATGESTRENTTEHTVECSLPLSAAILKDYSNGTMVKSKTMNDWRTHNGVDFTGESGDEIRAVCPGTVKDVFSDTSWGKVVVIEHKNGFTARYCGLDTVNVNKGDDVEKDFVIGTLGVIPIESADTPHLHFEVLSGEKYVDPLEALSMQREDD